MANITTTSIDPITGQTLYTTRADETTKPSAIPAESLANTKLATIPEKAKDNTDYAGIINGGMGMLNASKTTETKQPEWFEKYLTGSVAPTNTVDLYRSMEQSAGIPSLEQDISTRQDIQTKAQKELDILNAQLKDISGKSTQAQLQLETPEGQAGDVTQAFLSKQQQEVSRQAAIKAIPIQTQALVAEAKLSSAKGDVLSAQNALKMAKDRIGTLFKIQSDYEQNIYQYNKDLRNSIMEYATEKEKQELEKQQKEEDNKFDLLKKKIDNSNNIAKMAIDSGQADVAAKISALDINSPTYDSDLFKLVENIKTKEKILSPTEAKVLGVPYGTTEEQAQEMGITPKDAGDKFSKQEVMKMETDLRKEFNGLQSIKDYNAIKNANTQINSAYQEALKSGAEGKSKASADQVLIVAFNKMLDPTSVVREGEYARSTEGQSLIARLQGKAQSALQGGTGLTDADRNQIVSMTKRLYKDYLNLYDDKVSEYRGYVSDFGGNPDKIAPVSLKELKDKTGTNDIDINKMLEDSDYDTVKQFLQEQSGNISGGGGTPTDSSDAQSIVNAIKQTESSGNYNIKGASGESGAYQFMPNTWNSYKKEYEKETGEKITGQTPENQDKVALFKIQQWLDDGYNVKQIASMWNAGEGRPDAWKNWKGVNAFGVAYDTPAYVNKVLKNLG